MRLAHTALVVLVAAAPSPHTTADLGGSADAACIGEGPQAVVYLHGMDAVHASPEELDNRRALAALARVEGLRIALPRATRPCPTEPSSRCWGWGFSDDERADLVNAVNAAAAACFGSDVDYGVLGFSNGGYAITELVARGEATSRLPHTRWIVTVGASKLDGNLWGPPLSAQPPVVMLAGEEDPFGFDPADHYASLLRRAGARVTSRRYPGAHALAGAPLAEAIRTARAAALK